MKQIILPAHPDMVGTRICPHCDGYMKPCTTSMTYQLKEGEFHLCNIKAFRCTACGEEVFTTAEARLIEEALRPHMQGKVRQ